VVEELNKIRQIDPLTFKVAYAVSAIPARYTLERREWGIAAKLPLYPAEIPTFPWAKFRWAEAHIQFARAVGAERSGDTKSARKEIDELVAIHKSLTEMPGDYDWAKQVDIERQIASGWLKYAEGNNEEALRIMRYVAILDDETDKHPVTPGALLPAREQLGELLLELKDPVAALAEFETALRNTPNRFNALLGAARAAKLANDRAKARAYYRKLVELCRFADTQRPEVEEAKNFVGASLRGRPLF